MDRIFSPFREFGFFAGALYVIDRLLLRLTPRARLLTYDLMAQPIASTPVLPPERSRKLQWRELKPGDPDLDAIAAPHAVRQQRFAQGAICLATYNSERLVGYVWLCFDQYDEDEARCTYLLMPSDQAVFDFDLVVLPEYRMGLGFASVWHCTNEYLHRRNVTCSFSRITRFNLASRRSHARLGAVRIGRLAILKVGRAQAIFATIGPYFHFSANEKRRAAVRLVGSWRRQ
jgi:hypothetical protein